MKGNVRFGLATGSAVVAACGLFAHGPPKSMAGDVPIRIVNASASRFCGLYATRDGQATVREMEHSWISVSGGIAKGDAKEFRVQPGSYAFGVEICNDFGAHLNNAQPIAIDGPTEITMGDETIARQPSPGMKQVKASFQKQTCAPANYDCSEMRCCADLVCIQDGAGGVCRPRASE